MREVIDAVNLLAAMDRRRAVLAAGNALPPPEPPLEAIRELRPDEARVFDATGLTGTAAAIRAHLPHAVVDDDATCEHDAALVGTALARNARPHVILDRVAGALKSGGRALILIPNRRSLFLIAGLAKNRPFTLPGAWPETGPGAVTLAEVTALLDFARFTNVTIEARIGEAIPPDVAFPAQIAYDGVAIDVQSAPDLRDFLTIAYVVSAISE